MTAAPVATRSAGPGSTRSARAFVALGALALGGFGVGASEFVSMRLLPQISQGLLGDLFAADPQAATARARWLIGAYALGVVVGAPVIAVAAARASRSRLTVGLLLALAIGTFASALAPTFESVLAARFVAGLPHGAYLGLAALVAGRILGPGNQGKGIAVAMSGLTIANVIGVPAMTWLGQAQGWRAAYLLAGAIFVLALVLAMHSLPTLPGDPTANARRELSAFGNGQVWLVMGIGAIGFGGFFAVYAYLADVTTRVTGLADAAVPAVLAATGLGMTLGNLLGGRAADRNGERALLTGLVGLALSMLAFAALTGSAMGLFAAAFAVGFAAMYVGPAVQARLIAASGDAPLLGASMNHSAFNVGNTLGAVLGGQVISAGLGYRAPALVGVVLALAGLALALISLRLERRAATRPPTSASRPRHMPRFPAAETAR
ncbi:MAG: MFS transporter [Actinobacteria bacterium]|uniref:MFS transporter n=1 Tax=Nostocoides veronense TaxID=330836 RepID=UPI0031DC4AC9|nr:MFS transporter [Actinomycetota bacterium]